VVSPAATRILVVASGANITGQILELVTGEKIVNEHLKKVKDKTIKIKKKLKKPMFSLLIGFRFVYIV
jgi:hypothetical protein